MWEYFWFFVAFQGLAMLSGAITSGIALAIWGVGTNSAIRKVAIDASATALKVQQDLLSHKRALAGAKGGVAPSKHVAKNGESMDAPEITTPPAVSRPAVLF